MRHAQVDTIGSSLGFFIATGYAQDQRQTVTLLGISCNNDFYVTAVGVAGAVVGTVLSRAGVQN
jgi:hypothetical protein